MKKVLINFLATFVGIGYLPVFPGTWASLMTTILIYLSGPTLPLTTVLFFLILSIAVGIPAATSYDLLYRTKDSQHIVIDEVAGQLLTLLPIFILKKHLPIYYLVALVLFRIFDIAKPLGIKKLQALHGGVGVVADDLLAGCYGAIILGGIIWLVK